ncbi:MAG: hypothetical protein ACTSP1_16415 [Candidatus Freyarchaeota archaeon]
MNREISIMNEEWDYLIILDAWGYDYFSNLYIDYLQGELEKVYSPASCTPEWRKKSFKGYYKDVIYISANPYINSKVEIEGFSAKNHFSKIIDVWNWGWDEKLGTVHYGVVELLDERTRVFSGTLYNYITLLLIVVLAAINTVIIANAVGAQLFGSYSVGKILLDLLTVLCSVGMGASLIRFLPDFLVRKKIRLC